MKKFLCIVWGIALSISISTAQIALSFNPEKGTTYEYKLDTYQNANQKVMQQDIKMEQRMNTTYSMTVVDKNKEEIKTIFTYKDILFELTSPFLNMKYDSKKTMENPMELDQIIETIFGSIIDKQFEMVFFPDGSVKSVTGMEAIVEEMTNVITKPEAKKLFEGMKSQFSDDAIKSSFSQSFKIYPEEKVKPGESWTLEQAGALPGGIDTTIKTIYTLQSADKKMASIGVHSEFGDSEGIIKGTQNGEIKLDVKTGLSNDSKITQNITSEQKTNGMDVAINIESQIITSMKAIK